ncbi:MAG: hypothetical protein IJD92_04480 [Bacilli bacterium]|nr:hypothetical protein [Bacilli bacterium]
MKDTILVNYYEIDGMDYIIVNEIDYDGVHYIYLCNENDKDDILIRKVVDGYLELLDSEEELREVMSLIIK